ncbi:unnamed protein product, partial [Tetraodon nigroviridis]
LLVPPSKVYFDVDMATPWVAGKKYTITCVALDAKPAADITVYKDGVELTGVESFPMSGSKDKLENTHAQVTVTALSYDNGRQLACHASSPASHRPAEARMTMRVFYPPQPPVINGLEGEEVLAGRTLSLQCVSYGGNPLATLQWTKVSVMRTLSGVTLSVPKRAHHLLLQNGEALSISWKEDTEAQRSISTIHLMIKPADNQAELSCESANLVSLSPLSVSLKITVLFEPAEVTLLGSLTAVEGQDLDLTCSASSSNPPVQIRWWLGHKELNASAVTLEEGSHGGMTTMSNMTHRVSRDEDGLKLTCEAFSKGMHFSKSQTDTLVVFYPPQKVWLEAPPHNVPLHSGTTVRLICFATGGNPAVTLTWYKNRAVVPGALKQTTFNRGVARELVVVLTASDNMAVYRCNANNEAKKTVSAQTRFKVYFTAIGLKITAQQTELRRGQTLTLECNSGTSNPKASIFWSLGTHRLEGVEQSANSAPYGGVSVSSILALNLTSQHHKQRVICQAYSPVLEDGTNTFFQLDVRYPPEFSLEQPTRIQVLEDDVATIPLLVSANPEEVSCIWLHRRELVRDSPNVHPQKDPVLVNLGETADLICVVDANPIKSDMFTWTFLGETEWEMEENTQEDESGVLTIYNATRAHAGLYQCTADNGIPPPASASVQLVVQFKPELQKGAQWRKVASRGDGTTTAELTCQAEGIPPVDFIWEKKGLLMDFANPRYRWDHSPGFLYADVIPLGTASFTITGLQPATTYNFSVNALNAVGESAYADDNAVLTITTAEKPKAEESPTDDDSVEPRDPGGKATDREKIEEKGSSLSVISNSNKYESGEKINTVAQRTLLESSTYYYPIRDSTMPLSPHPQEIHMLDFTHPPVDSHSHVYEEVGDEHVYQDILPSSPFLPPPVFDHRLPNQRRSRWRPSTRSQVRAQKSCQLRALWFEACFTLIAALTK